MKNIAAISISLVLVFIIALCSFKKPAQPEYRIVDGFSNPYEIPWEGTFYYWDGTKTVEIHDRYTLLNWATHDGWVLVSTDSHEGPTRDGIRTTSETYIFKR